MSCNSYGAATCATPAGDVMSPSLTHSLLPRLLPPSPDSLTCSLDLPPSIARSLVPSRPPRSLELRDATPPGKPVPPSRADLGADQREVYDAVVDGRQSCFITGNAGTGKSFLLRVMIDAMKTRDTASRVCK